MAIIPASELSITNYHNACPQWLSKTTLRDFQKMGAARWHATYVAKTLEKDRPDGAAQGLALDCLLTESYQDYVNRFAIKPDGMSFATKDGKAWRAGQEGKIILSSEDELILRDAADAVRLHPRWPDIQKCQAQTTIRRYSESLGLGLQSRPDWLNTAESCLFDLKKTRDLDIFGKQAIDLGYHTQAAIAGWCLSGESIQLEHAYLVAVEWERKARCRVYEIPHEALAYADQQMRLVAAEIADRLNRNVWTDQAPSCEPLPIPEHMRRRMEAA